MKMIEAEGLKEAVNNDPAVIRLVGVDDKRRAWIGERVDYISLQDLFRLIDQAPAITPEDFHNLAAESRLRLVAETLRAAERDMMAAQSVICHICKHYYQPDPDVRRYACRIYGPFPDEDDGTSICCLFDWRGLVEGVNDDETANTGGD